MTKLATAQALAERGFPVFPVKAGAKFPPLWRDWPNRATTNLVDVGSWPTDANIAIHTAGLIVLDVDVRANGDATLDKLDLLRGLPATLTTRTPTGGRHLFYRLPAGHPGVPNGANRLGPGIDIKSTNGYVLAPGSEVPAGRYRFEADVPIADAPEWLVRELGAYTNREQKKNADIPDAPAEVVERAKDWLKSRPVGDQAFATACGLRDFGLSHAQATSLLLEHDGRNVSILGPKIDHAYKYAQNEPGVRAVSAADFPVVEAPAAKRERPKPKKLHELAKNPPGPYLVKGVLQRAAHAVIYGAPGAGKTFVALDLAYHVAAGKEWQGRRVKQGTVLYLAYEGIGGMAKRAAAIAQRYRDDVPLFISGADYNLRDTAGRRLLGEDLAQLPERPVLIVIDTLARAMKGGDENSAMDMGAMNDAVSALIEATGACVLLVHHSGKNKSSGARGSSALLGAIDTEFEVDSRQIISRKQRDVELSPPMGFRLAPVVVGLDEDGDEIVSCVVEACTPVAERLAGLPENCRLGLDALADLAPDNELVDGDLWRAKCREFLPQQDSAARKSFYRLRNGLVDRGVVEKVDGKFRRKMQ